MNYFKSIVNKIIHAVKKPEVLVSYEEKRAILKKNKEAFGLNTLVETGTFLGDTVEFFKNQFGKVYSIELSEELAEKAKKRFQGQQNVEIIQGDSGEVLANLVTRIQEPALFWLDGHYSSEFYLNGEFIRTARSAKDTPIEKELDILLNADYPHIILIDDARLFNGHGDYPTVAALKLKVGAARHTYQLSTENDIISILPIKPA